jgi:large subunit ribosomal protein L4
MLGQKRKRNYIKCSFLKNPEHYCILACGISSEVRGTNRKPFPQKGRGAARHGSLRNPQFRGGGVAHGPRGTNWHYTLSRKVRALGYRIVLSVKMAQGNLSIIDKIPDCEGKTGMFHFHLTQRGCGPKRSILLVGKTVTSLAERGLFTLPYCKLLALEDLNMHDILKYKEIAIERDAIELLANYLSNDGKRIRTFLNDKT